MSKIIVPTEEQIRLRAYQMWCERKGGHGFDQFDWFAAQEALALELNYRLIAKHKLVDDKKTKFGSKENKTCRFCFQKQPDTTFGNVAHSIPEFLGNKALFSRDECDRCNAFFAGTIETAFGEMLNLYLANAQLFGKKNKKTFESTAGNARVEASDSKVDVKQTRDSDFMATDNEAKTFRLKDNSKKVVPCLVFKCLAKMAISVMPDPLIPHCQRLASWIRASDISDRPPGTASLKTYMTVVPGNRNDYPGAVSLFVRRKHDAPLPSVLFLLTFRNLAFQIALPLCDFDLTLPEGCEVFPIPHWHRFDILEGPPSRQIIDLSSGKPEQLWQVHDGKFKGIIQTNVSGVDHV